ncbi:hypothetical protein [Streptomyces sp. DH37]|uniref:hypothetical protein n=1 Tax=Streptomyces sp. DH37 TaxID=3040122 RepID=UPI0024417A09|nr:hypothetical protein [Streptomyces sp. DH37]MDG9701990.1 hypothetical protein [Streptomyces sp. DH37]
MRNCLGQEISGPEEELVDLYRSVCRLVEERLEEMPPYQARNTLKALSCLWQIVNGLDMEPRHLYHVGL